MTSTPSVDAPDPREVLTEQVFSSLCQSVFGKATDSLIANKRLWQLPEVATYFVYCALTDDDKRRVEPTVHRLRARVGKLINDQLDRSAVKRAIAETVAIARREFVLRSWQPADAVQLASFLGSQRLWQGLPDDYPGQMNEQLAGELIAISNGWSERHSVNAVEWRGHPVGQVRLQFDSSPFPDAAEISYWIAEPYWGQGIATKVVALFTADSFSCQPHIHRIFAQVLEGNLASMRVLEKVGYRYESFRYQNVTKSDGRHSSHIFGICRADYEFPSLRDDAILSSRER
jgi:ribosomal-protein-alanine N-acetyltransferase